MEREKKNLLLTFIELATSEGLLQDDIAIQKKKVFSIMNEIEKSWIGDKKLFVQLERAIIDVLELTQYKYFDYGKIANEIDENYTLEYDPFERLAR